jgi:hypothetical protein
MACWHTCCKRLLQLFPDCELIVPVNGAAQKKELLGSVYASPLLVATLRQAPSNAEKKLASGVWEHVREHRTAAWASPRVQIMAMIAMASIFREMLAIRGGSSGCMHTLIEKSEIK